MRETHAILSALILITTIIMTTMMATPALAVNTTTILSGSDVRISLVNQDPDPAAAGDTVELRIGIENQGQDVKDNLVMEVIPSYPFLALQGEDLAQTVGTLTGYQVSSDMRIMKFKMRVDNSATAGDYTLKVWVYKKDNRGTLS